MTTIKTQDLEGAALDWAVAKAVGYEDHLYYDAGNVLRHGPMARPWRPSVLWENGGPLIEEWGVELETAPPWSAYLSPGITVFGGTALEAACRAVVASVYGDQVDVPEELVKKEGE